MLSLLLACDPDAAEGTAPTSVSLTWYRSDPAESWELALTGLDWALSQVGATPPSDGTAVDVQESRPDRVQFTLHLDRLALAPAAQTLLAEVAEEMAAAEGTGDDDLGRFLMRSLHEPWRYYALTGACPTLAEWESKRPALTLEYAVTTSLLLSEERLVLLPPAQTTLADVAFRSSEGAGSLADATFVASAYETVDLMPNGQFRYAVYDDAGRLQPAGATTETGTPGKCAWCHETSIHAGTAENESAPGYLDYAGWLVERDAAQAQVEALRASLSTSVAYAGLAAHVDGERLVEGFLHPSAARVAAEWGTTEAAVMRELGVGEHMQEEFGWTERYTRTQVDHAAPFRGAVATQPSARDLTDEAGLAAAPEPECR